MREGGREGERILPKQEMSILHAHMPIAYQYNHTNTMFKCSIIIHCILMQ